MAFTDEINWSLFDFIIMGSLLILLSIGINFASNRAKNLKNRVLYIGILVIIFMLIWAELAVGVFGTSFCRELSKKSHGCSAPLNNMESGK